MVIAHIAKEKGEQSKVNNLMIKQATEACPKQQTQTKKQIQQIPLPEGGYTVAGRSRGQKGCGRGNYQKFRSEILLTEGQQQAPFRGGRGGQSGRGWGRGRGHGGQRGGYNNKQQ